MQTILNTHGCCSELQSEIIVSLQCLLIFLPKHMNGFIITMAMPQEVGHGGHWQKSIKAHIFDEKHVGETM